MRAYPPSGPADTSLPGLEAASEIAIAGLSHIAGNAELLDRFLALTGMDPARIRREAERPAFLAGVLEFYLGHEPTLYAFAEASGYQPQAIAAAHRQLAGSGQDGSPDFP